MTCKMTLYTERLMADRAICLSCGVVGSLHCLHPQVQHLVCTISPFAVCSICYCIVLLGEHLIIVPRLKGTFLYSASARRELLLFRAETKLTLCSFLPIVLLALVFNLSNVLGFTYADRDAQKRWANSALSSGNIFGFGFGGIGGQLVGGLVRNSLGRVMG